MLNKNSLRKIILSRLRRMKKLSSFDERNRLINQRVQNELQTRRGIWAAFMPLSVEPNLTETYQKFAGQIQFAFPKVVGKDIHFYLGAKDTEFQKGQHGILEPDHKNSLRVFASDFAGMLIPGVAFDSEGNRLGRGRAFYDRFLKTCAAKKIGVCFQTQFIKEKIQTEPHDEKIELLITEGFRLKIAPMRSFTQGFDLSGFSERNYI